MWITFNSIEQNKNLVSKKTGKTYTGWILNGTKLGYGDSPDEPYEKIFFDNSSTTIIEHGRKRPNKSIVQYFQKACEAGDTIIITNERSKNGWDIVSLENITKHSSHGKAGNYEPLTDEELMAYETPVPTAPQEVTSDSLPWAS